MNLIQRGTISFLALLMFTTSACFAVDVHRCGDEVKSRSVFSRAQSCEKMAKELKAANKELPECCKQYEKTKIKVSNSEKQLKKKPCCVNESFSYKNDVNEDGQIVVPVFSNLEYDLPEFVTIVNENLEVATVTDFRINGPPEPDLKRDILTLFQVFII